MAQIIQLPIRSFAVVKRSKGRGFETVEQIQPVTNLRWANQVRNLNVPEPEAKDIASLIIEYGVNMTYSNLWESNFDGMNLFKMFRNKKFILQVDKATRDERGNLHNDNSPALESGKDKFYFLHGLQLSGEDEIKMLLTPPEKLDPQEILAIRNADFRREMIRKKGIEQVLDGLFHRVIDTFENYNLIQVILGTDTNSACNYLKMLNPSIGVWHMEGVPNNIRTVRDALLWRNNGWFVHAEDIT